MKKQDDVILFILEKDFPAGTTAVQARGIIGKLVAGGYKVRLLTAQQVQSPNTHSFSRRAGYVREVLAEFDELLKRDAAPPAPAGQAPN